MADLTRDTFNAARHYTKVRGQQGRVPIEADLNEQIDILYHVDRTEGGDVIGHAGAPKVGGGFRLQLAPDGSTLLFSPGRFYVDGILCEEEERVVGVTALAPGKATVSADDARALAVGQWLSATAAGKPPVVVKITAIDGATGVLSLSNDVSTLGLAVRLQLLGDFLAQPDRQVAALPGLSGARTLAYLDVWERELTALDDRLIRETALGGPDTSTRLKAVWQLRLLPLTATGTIDCSSQLGEWDTLILPPTGRLSARSNPSATGDQPCVVRLAGGYRRLENQLYRVQIHDPGPLGTATFKWSRENGSIIMPVSKMSGGTLALGTTGRDEVLGLADAEWLELTDDNHELEGKPGLLLQITDVQGLTVNVDVSGLPGHVLPVGDFTANPKVKRWEGAIGANPVKLGDPSQQGYLDLEDGVQVRFEDGTYATGDYWIIPARTLVSDVEWPRDPVSGTWLAQPRRGITHHFARLAIIDGSAGSITVSDCRKPFPPLTEITADDVSVDCDCTVLKNAKTVQDAIDILCDEKDLRFHNQHLHGWGIVCGLQVTCGPDSRREGAPLHDRVTVNNGYAIDGQGNDIIVDTRDANGKQTGDVLEILQMLHAKNLLTDTSGHLVNGSVSLILQPGSTIADRYRLELYDPKMDQGWWHLFDGTIWRDMYDDCILPIIDFLKQEFTAPDPANVVVGPTAEHLITFLNLIAQFQTNGQHVYVSEREDEILREFFNGLKELLSSKTYCALFDPVRFPSYTFLTLKPEQQKPTTIFGKGLQTQLRVNGGGTLGATLAGGTTINLYDVQYDGPPSTDPATGNKIWPRTHEKLLVQLDFPTAGTVVQDVLFSPDGAKLYAVAIQNGKDSLFAVADLSTPTKPTWGKVSVICDHPLVRLGYSARRKQLYALATGLGLCAIDPNNIVANQPTGYPIANAWPQMVINDFGDTAFAYVGVGSGSAYASVARIDLSSPTSPLAPPPTPPPVWPTYVLPRSSSDELAIATDTNGKFGWLFAVVEPSGFQTNKQLVRFDALKDPGGQTPSQTVDLGDHSAYALCYVAKSGLLALACTDAYYVKLYDVAGGGNALVDPTRFFPTQIAPCSITSDAQQSNIYVLNHFSMTLTVLPAVYLNATPPVVTVDKTDPTDPNKIVGLVQYRWAALNSYFQLLGKIIQHLKDCFCDHLLIHCPDDKPKTLYLARLDIRDQQVHNICNFSHRKYVHSFPTVEYWMSVVPILPMLEKAVENFCCWIPQETFKQTLATPSKYASVLAPTQVMYGIAGSKALFSNLWSSGGSKLNLIGLMGSGVIKQAVSRPPQAIVTAPVGLKPQLVLGAREEVARTTLANSGVTVAGVERFDPNSHLAAVLSAPGDLPRGANVKLLLDESGQVMGYAPATPAGGGDTVAINQLKEEVTRLKTEHATALAARDATIATLQTQVTDLQTNFTTKLSQNEETLKTLSARFDAFRPR